MMVFKDHFCVYQTTDGFKLIRRVNLSINNCKIYSVFIIFNTDSAIYSLVLEPFLESEDLHCPLFELASACFLEGGIR